MPKLAIIGSNDLGKLIAYHALSANWELAGFFDNRKAQGTVIENYGKVLGDVDSIEDCFTNKMFDYLMVGVGYTQFNYRKSIFERFKGVVPFANIIHRSAYIDGSVSLAEGIFILPGCVLDMEVTLGDNVLLNTGCRIAHHSKINDHCFVAPGVTIAGKVVIDECCLIGVGSTIQDNVHLCPGVLIGGGALVTSDISEPGTYVGVPARKIKENIYFK